VEHHPRHGSIAVGDDLQGAHDNRKTVRVIASIIGGYGDGCGEMPVVPKEGEIIGCATVGTCISLKLMRELLL
jgi:hypothetical protein